MEQEHTPLWSVERIFRAIAAVNGGSDDPYVTLEATGKVLRKLHDEYEAARREQAQRVAALEALRREQYERANGLSESNNALLDENIAYRQRVEQLEAEVARLTKKANTTMECAEQTLAELQQDYDALASSHFMLRLARDELLRREYLAMPAQPDRND